ncbi:hypothetical protein TNCV_3800781 [Trichonephila clavipes]|nr:hypothetical protein TNCV_3800781 [Trichonephila clavipes]
MLPTYTVFEVPENWKTLGERSGCMVHGPRPLSQQIRLTLESFEKCEALRYRGEAKHLLTACYAVCFVMHFGVSVELRSWYLSRSLFLVA